MKDGYMQLEGASIQSETGGISGEYLVYVRFKFLHGNNNRWLEGNDAVLFPKCVTEVDNGDVYALEEFIGEKEQEIARVNGYSDCKLFTTEDGNGEEGADEETDKGSS